MDVFSRIKIAGFSVALKPSRVLNLASGLEHEPRLFVIGRPFAWRKAHQANGVWLQQAEMDKGAVASVLGANGSDERQAALSYRTKVIRLALAVGVDEPESDLCMRASVIARAVKADLTPHLRTVIHSAWSSVFSTLVWLAC